jgi:hypothetical protein
MRDWSSGLTRCWNSNSAGCLAHGIEQQWYNLVKLRDIELLGLFSSFCSFLQRFMLRCANSKRESQSADSAYCWNGAMMSSLGYDSNRQPLIRTTEQNQSCKICRWCRIISNGFICRSKSTYSLLNVHSDQPFKFKKDLQINLLISSAFLTMEAKLSTTHFPSVTFIKQGSSLKMKSVYALSGNSQVYQ